jgi:hypothetical protein
VFRARGEPTRLRDLVKFRWQMAAPEDGSVAGVGLELLFLAGDGRIRADYPFIES